MYGNLRKDENDSSKPISAACWQKPSPTSGDDCTKGENTQNGHDGGTGTNRYARKKSGLKPIRPANISSANLNPVTPGRLPQTPRLNFKENDNSRHGIHDFPSTPKFGRSESTPELHRIRKLDSLRQPIERSGVTDRSHSNVLQDSSASNLLTMTSDSLPDIFRKPIISQQQDGVFSLQSKFAAVEDKVSKWGYGPSCNTQSISSNNRFQLGDNHKENSSKFHAEEHHVLKPIEESPVVTSKFIHSLANPPPSLNWSESRPLPKTRLAHESQEEPHSVSSKSTLPQGKEEPTDKQYENHPVSSTKPPHPQPPAYEPMPISTKSPDRSGLNSTSDTASALGLSSQFTVKQHPLNALSTPFSHTPIAKKLSWNNQHSSLVTPKLNNPTTQRPPLYSLKPEGQVDAKVLSTPIKPVIESNIHPASVVKPLQPDHIKQTSASNHHFGTQPVTQTQDCPEQQNKNVAPTATSSNVFHPPSSRAPSKHKQITVNGKHYTVMKPLGRGGSSVVYQVLNQEMTDVFALKVVRLDSVDEITAEGYINEVRLLKQLQDLPRVVRLLEFEYNEEEEKLLLVMEKGDTDLASVIRNRTSLNAINPILVRFYWQEMLEAVGEIHRKNVIHTDLKPANFLLVNGGLKLIDFGIATSIQADMTSIMKDSQCGTYNYMAPEAIKSASPVGANQEYKISRKTDVWSLGCMLYSLIYKNPPFNKFRDTIEKISAIVDERHVIDFPPTADPMVIAVLKGCLDRNPRNRPSIEELLAHPYLTCMNQPQGSSVKDISSQIRSQLDPYIQDGKLKEEAKQVIKQWM